MTRAEPRICARVGCGVELHGGQECYCSKPCADKGKAAFRMITKVCERVGCDRIVKKSKNRFCCRECWPRSEGPRASWDAETTMRLEKLWHEGHPTAEIGRRLNGISKNSVISKAGRIGLPARPSPIKTSSDPERRPRPRSCPRPAQTLPHFASVPSVEMPKMEPQGPRPMRQPPSVIAEAIPFMALPLLKGACAYPLNDRRPWLFCDKPALYGQSYCPEHRDICRAKTHRNPDTDEAEAA